MGKIKEHPRYKVLTLRCSDTEARELLAAKPAGMSVSEYLRRLTAIGASLYSEMRDALR